MYVPTQHTVADRAKLAALALKSPVTRLEGKFKLLARSESQTERELAMLMDRASKPHN